MEKSAPDGTEKEFSLKMGSTLPAAVFAVIHRDGTVETSDSFKGSTLDVALLLADNSFLQAFQKAIAGTPAMTEVSLNGSNFACYFIPKDSERATCMAIDITDSKKSGKSEFRHRTLFNSAHDAIFTMDNKTFVDCNEATLRMFQCRKDQIVGQTPYRFSPLRQPDGRLSEESAMEKINAAMSGKPQSFEWRHIRYDGTPFDAEVSLNRLDLEDEVQIQAIVRDIDQRKRAEEEHRRLALVANTTTNIVVIANGEGKIEWVNPAFTRITGYTLDEVRGKKPGSFLRGPQTDAHATQFMRAKLEAGEGFKDIEIVNYNKKGEPYWISIEVQPIHNSAGKAVQFIAIETEVSERKAHQQAIIDRNEDLSKINAELDRFVYSASHDLRAPISSLLGLIQVARLEKNVDNLSPLFELQEKSLQRLDRFIKDIVDHSRNTRLIVESIPVNFEQLVKAAFEQLQFLDNASRIRRVIKIDQKGTFHTAVTRVDIILNNLISNALKYADLRRDNPFIEVQITSDDKQAELRVIDNGEGITTDAKPKIFDMFFRASANGSGSGLGLYIVKEAVQKIGGSITVHSEYGKGTEFVVLIPNRFSK